MKQLQVLCVGAATLDTIAVVADYPAQDSRVPAEQLLTAGGGPAATAAVALARLGVRVGFAGVIADDEAGHRVREGLAQEGVDTSWLVVGGPRTAASVVVVSARTASRTILAVPAVAPEPERVPVHLAQWVHVDQTGYAAARTALRERPGALLSIDAGNEVPGLALDDAALYAPTLASLQRRFPEVSAEEALAAARADGAGLVVATDGERGAFHAGPDGSGSVPARTTPVVSTLGAGDVFHGALLAGLLDGLALGEATWSASTAAALSCRALDGRSAIPHRDELDTELALVPRGETHAS